MDKSEVRGAANKVAGRRGFVAAACAALVAAWAPGPASAEQCQALGAARVRQAPVTLASMGSFFFGGTVDRTASGDTFHGDHGYAQYFVPQRARGLPLVMWHGHGQSGKTWESTPDGREGFWQIFTRRGWPVFIIDQPRRGRASYTRASGTALSHAPEPAESGRWGNFRIGPWRPPEAPSFFPGVQFSQDPEAIDQFLRQQAPNTGPEPFPDADHRKFLGRAAADLLRRTGPAILLTHSHSGQYGWATAMEAPELVRAIIAYEPGEFAFPESEPPAEIETPSEVLSRFMAPQLAPDSEFDRLTRMPILIVYGDNISDRPSAEYGPELWRMASQRAQQFVATVNRRGGDARYVELPDTGLCGNTHFPMSDLNNLEVADQLSAFFSEKRLDGRRPSYAGPRAE